VQLEIWQNFANFDDGDDEEAGDSLTAAQFVAKCGSWWRPRQPRLTAYIEAAVFEVQVRRLCLQAAKRMGQLILLPLELHARWRPARLAELKRMLCSACS